jgi:hypothetical protein
MNVWAHVIEWTFSRNGKSSLTSKVTYLTLRSVVGLNGENTPPKNEESHPTLLNFHFWQLSQLLEAW